MLWYSTTRYYTLMYYDSKAYDVVSSWGPYTSTVGTAKGTGVPGKAAG